MWSQNNVTERLNIEYPIFLAPMAELITPVLAAEVSNAGGLGSLGMWGFTLEAGVARIEQFSKAEQREFEYQLSPFGTIRVN